MSTIKIEDGIPLPSIVQDRVSLPKLPLDDMVAGQSFRLAMDNNRDLDKTLNALRMKIQRYQKKHQGVKFAVITESPEAIRVFCRAPNEQS